MDDRQFDMELERNFKALTRLYNVLKADLFRLESTVSDEGMEIMSEVQKIVEALNFELKNLQKLIKLARLKESS